MFESKETDKVIARVVEALDEAAKELKKVQATQGRKREESDDDDDGMLYIPDCLPDQVCIAFPTIFPVAL